MWFAVKNVIKKKAFFWPPESLHTVEKENQIFLILKEIQNGAIAKSYMTNGLHIYVEIIAHILIY
jgi:hypothetical protein